MKNHGFRFLVILAIAALSVWATIRPGLRLGLDLAGGSSLTYTVTSDETLSREKLDSAIEVITKRVNATGLTEIYIASTAAGEIVVEMPRRSTDEIRSVKELIERNGQLEFRIRAESTEEVAERARRDATPPHLYKLKDARWVPVDPKSDEYTRAEPDMLVKTPEAPLEREYLALKATKGEAHEETVAAYRKYLDVKQAEVFKGEDLESPRLDTDGAQLVVAFAFRDARKNDFKDFTARNVKKPMAIILDGKVSSAPVIQSVLPGRGIITGGRGGFKESEANDLRIVLESGSTGVHLTLDREETLGASLGDVAIERGKWSVIVGFLAVVVLMLYYYRLPGLVANLALLLNVLITLGAMAFFRGALSLPGIAGIVLGLGMAIDANILTFERLRDERRRGKTLAESIAAGYDNAMSAIVDGNVTALLSAFVLMALGTGAVRGFGVTLAIGLLASMFTAVWVTRCVFEFLVDKRWMTTFDIGKDPREPNLDYMRGRRLFILPSIVIMIAGVIGFLVRDDNASKDLEFIGGQQVLVQLNRPFTADEITRIAKGPDNRWEDATAVGLEAQGVDAPRGSTNRWQIRAKARSETEGKEYVKHLTAALADASVAPGFTEWNVSGGSKPTASFRVHTLSPVADAADLKAKIESQGLSGVTVAPVEGADARTHAVSAELPDGGDIAVKAAVRRALMSYENRIYLSDPFPSVSFLSASQAENQWRAAMKAVLLSLAFQIVYIRIRFADYTHGFAAAVALIHDVTVTMGAVALFDSMEWVYAKVNLVLIAAFLTLIGYSMNDTIVIFDRIRENLGRSKVIRSRMVNDSINQTFSRSVRTSVIVFATVIVQFLFNRNLGSSIEGFAFVMTIGVIAGAYSTYFIASPLLLFLPGYGRKLTANRWAFTALCVAAAVGSIVAVTAKGSATQLWIGVALASLIPLHFLSHFIPWLSVADPDSLVVEATEEAVEEPPLTTPGV